jgi:WD40 repeat protein/energy-coupling factor transporter ATP-binding protein EcfA2
MTANSQSTVLFFENLGQIETTHDVLLNRRAQLPSPLDGTPKFWEDVTVFLEQARLGGVLLDQPRDRRVAQGVLDYWASALIRSGQPVPDLQLETFDATMAPILRGEKPCPFQGLEAFTAERSDYFFGRESLVEDILQKVKEGQRLFLVTGASGSGKSSLLKAGLIPRLMRGEDLSGSECWRYLTMVPGHDPVNSLNEVLRESPDNPPAGDTSRPTGLETRDIPDQGARLVIVVDQFEEVFTLSNEASRNEFVGCLFGLLQERGMLAFLTIRDDYVNELQQLPEKYSSWILHKDARVLVEALSLTELRSAIEKPAAKVGLRFSDGIVDDLAGKVLGQTAGLPLLQFTLLRLWDNLDRNRITKEDYDKVGDPLTSLQKCADEFYRSLIPQDKKLVEQILARRLVNIDEGKEATGKRTKLKDVFELDDPAAPEDIARILAEMICKKRLIKLSGVPANPCASADRESAQMLLVLRNIDHGGVAQIEVAHEALIRNWDQMRDWLVHERERKRDRWTLTRAADDWIKENSRDECYLYTGAQLDRVLEADYPDLRPHEKEFIERSEQRRDRKAAEETARRNREEQLKWIAITSVALSAIIIVFTILIATYRNSRAFAFETARLLAGRADQEMVGRPELGLLLAAEAVDKTVTGKWPKVVDDLLRIDSDSVVRSLYDKLGSYEATVQLPEAAGARGDSPAPQIMSVSPDSHWVAAVSGGGESGIKCTVNIWHLDYEPTALPQLRKQGDCTEVALLRFDKNSTKLAVVQTNGAVDLISLDQASSEPESFALTGQVDSLHSTTVKVYAISPNLRLRAVGDSSGKLQLFDTDGPPSELLPEDSVAPSKVEFSSDGQWLASVNVSGTLNLWNVKVKNPKPISNNLPFGGGRDQAFQVLFSGDNHWLAIASSSYPDAYLLDLHGDGLAGNATPLPSEVDAGKSVHSMAFGNGEDGTPLLLAVGYDNGVVLLWNLISVGEDKSGIPTQQPEGSTTLVSLQPLIVYEHSAMIDRLVFDQQRPNTFISSSADGTARIFDLSGVVGSPEGYAELIGTLYSRGGMFRAVFFAPNDASQVFAIDGYALQLWRNSEAFGSPEVDDMLKLACKLAGDPLTGPQKKVYLEEDKDYESVCERLSKEETR